MTRETPVAHSAPDPRSAFSLRNKIARYIWGWVWLLLFRPSPIFAYGWRRFLLRLFGARIGHRAVVHRSARVWAPWNLKMADNSCIGEFVDCYSAAPVILGNWAVVSQYCLLCNASHNYEADALPGTQSAITIGDYAWVAADVYVAPGVTIGDGAVVGARSSVHKSIPSWSVVGGNPARVIKTRRWRPLSHSMSNPGIHEHVPEIEES